MAAIQAERRSPSVSTRERRRAGRQNIRLNGELGAFNFDLFYQGKLIAIRIAEFGQPELGRWSSMNQMRVRHELNSFGLERGEDSLNVGHPEIDRRASLRILSCRHDANKQANRAAHEKSHLRRSREQKWNTKDISVERCAAVEVFDRNQYLSNARVRQVHRGLRQMANPSRQPATKL